MLNFREYFEMPQSCNAECDSVVLMADKGRRVTLCLNFKKRECETREESKVEDVGVGQRWRLTMVVKRASPAWGWNARVRSVGVTEVEKKYGERNSVLGRVERLS